MGRMETCDLLTRAAVLLLTRPLRLAYGWFESYIAGGAAAKVGRVILCPGVNANTEFLAVPYVNCISSVLDPVLDPVNQTPLMFSGRRNSLFI